MGCGDDQGLFNTAVSDLHFIGTALGADHFTSVTIEPWVVATFWDAWVDFEVDFLAHIVLLNRSLWWRSAAFSRFVREFPPSSLARSV